MEAGVGSFDTIEFSHVMNPLFLLSFFNLQHTVREEEKNST